MVDWEWVISVDLMGVVRGCHRFLPLFRRQAGQGRCGYIINMSSFAGLAAMPGLSAYGTAKAGVVALSEHLLTELAETGIGVSVVCPSFVRTRLLQDFRSADPSQREIVGRWMDKSGVTAAQVADRVFMSMLQKKFLVLTHAQTHWPWLMKRITPAWYYRQVARRFSQAGRKAT
jgi:NAD(P)-dependent dehydrogenase (short-subunit alcohol dehydrogenase family)